MAQEPTRSEKPDGSDALWTELERTLRDLLVRLEGRDEGERVQLTVREVRAMWPS